MSVPKSLHTVTVLVVMARMVRAARPAFTVEQCIQTALEQLGYTVEQDIYKLTEQALKKLNKSN